MIRLKTVLAIALALIAVNAGNARAQYQIISIIPATGVGTAVTPIAVVYPFGLDFRAGKLYTWDGSVINLTR